MTLEHNPIDNSSPRPQANVPQILGAICLGLIVLLPACNPEEPPLTPTPNPTPTKPFIVPNNDNVEALNAAKANLDGFEFGFAPLLQEDATRVVIERKPEG